MGKKAVKQSEPLDTQSAARGQGLLFFIPDAADEKLKQLAHGQFTGEQVRQDFPELHKVVVRMGSLNMSIRLTAELTGLSKNTVAAIYDSCAVGTAAQNASLAERARRCVLLLFDDLERRLENAKAEETKDLAVLCGILLDKLSNLQGGPTMTINVRHEQVPGFEDYLSQLKRVRPREMGLIGSAGEQMGAAGAGSAAVDLEASSAGVRTGSDTAGDGLSSALRSVSSDGLAGDTGCDAQGGTSPGLKVGGRGSRIAGATGGHGGNNPSRILGQMADASEAEDPPA